MSPVRATFHAVAFGTPLLLPFCGMPVRANSLSGSLGLIVVILYVKVLQMVVGLM